MAKMLGSPQRIYSKLPAPGAILHLIIVQVVFQGIWWGFAKLLAVDPIVRDIGALVVFVVAVLAVAWYLPKLVIWWDTRSKEPAAEGSQAASEGPVPRLELEPVVMGMKQFSEYDRAMGAPGRPGDVELSVRINYIPKEIGLKIDEPLIYFRDNIRSPVHHEPRVLTTTNRTWDDLRFVVPHDWARNPSHIQVSVLIDNQRIKSLNAMIGVT